jgi:hypothetical protein
MADPHVEQAQDKFQATIGSTAVTAGDMMYFDGTDWELADATDNTKFAEAVSVNTYKSGDVGVLCRRGIIRDIDAPYTQGSAMFLSETAGDITATRINLTTTAEALNQVVGFALDTERVAFDIKPLHEETINLQFPYTESAAPQDFDGDFHGVGLDDTDAAVGAAFMVPQNAVAVQAAYLWWSGTGTLLDTSDTYTIDVSGGVNDETTSATTDGITAASLAVAANDLAVADVTAAFDAAGLISPGNVVGIDVKKAAEGAGGDDPIMLCIAVVLECV